MHGSSKRRKVSEYGLQLKEKQKAKYMYGVLERQFRNLFEKHIRAKRITGTVLLQRSKSRPDNVVFRMGIAPSRSAARQLVSHKHITVNGEVVNIPSYTLRSGDVVGVREKSKSLVAITDSWHHVVITNMRGSNGTMTPKPVNSLMFLIAKKFREYQGTINRRIVFEIKII